MNRRDTMMIAVLLNVGVLAILFLLSINEGEEELKPSTHTEAPLARAETSHKSESKAVDLNQPENDDDDDFGQMDDAPIAFTDQRSQDSSQNDDHPTSTNSKWIEVEVKRGDVLSRMAKAYGTTVSAIKAANNLKTERLSVGQVLRIPVGKDTDPQKDEPIAMRTQEPTDAEYYTIKSGDNPWKLARQFHVRFEDLLKLNGWDEEKARNLQVGDRIRVR